MKLWTKRSAGFLMTMLVLPLATSPAGAELGPVWWTVDGGGFTHSQVGTLTLRGTAGQCDAGRLTGAGTLTLLGGFWSEGARAVSVPEDAIPETFRLDAAVPNPFNPTTTLTFRLPEASDCRLNVYDTAGRLVITLFEGRRDAGSHRFVWNGRDCNGRSASSGVYLVSLRAGEHHGVQKIVLIK